MHDGTVDGVVGGEEGILAGDVACNVVPHDEEGAAGTKESHIYNLGSYGCYWSSEDDTIGYNDFHFASGLSINNKGYSVSGIGGAWRLMGCSVRAVYIDK